MVKSRWDKERTNEPIPTDKSRLVQVRKPDWGRTSVEQWEEKLKTTWLGHAGFLIELPVPQSPQASEGDDATKSEGLSSRRRGITILADAVFADRMSPVSFAGPKRFTEPPCTAEELPPIDIILISHSHYDHLDIDTMRTVYARNKGHVKFFAGLGMRRWFCQVSGLDVREDEVCEMDWWDQNKVSVDLDRSSAQSPGIGSSHGEGHAEKKADHDTQIRQLDTVTLTCTPSQHASARTIRDKDTALWCSWALHYSSLSSPPLDAKPSTQSLYFAGDTALGNTATPEPSSTPCPAFAQIGDLLGPFDLALLPIGCFKPRAWMSNVHASPEDSLAIHEMVRSRKSIGMHYGAIRGGISGAYEGVEEGLQRWRKGAEEKGKWQTGEIGVCDVGETVAV